MVSDYQRKLEAIAESEKPVDKFFMRTECHKK